MIFHSHIFCPHRLVHVKETYYVDLCFCALRATSQSPALFSACICFTKMLPGLLLTLPLKRILFMNVKDCNFNLMRFKILCRTHMIDFLSYKLSSVITFYFMNTTPMPKLTQCSLIGNEKNCENIKHRPWFINMPVGSGVKTELSRKLCYQSWFVS